jgi:hypothetical protein
LYIVNKTPRVVPISTLSLDININICIFEMASCALLLSPNLVSPPVEEVVEPLIRIFGVRLPIAPNKEFNSAKNSSIGYKSGEYGGK